VSLISSIGTG